MSFLSGQNCIFQLKSNAALGPRCCPCKAIQPCMLACHSCFSADISVVGAWQY
ncbi:Uncharacterised protein [Vibrio cholerae]|nr:Uncharacterised protein [Vibrio cholerae]